MAGYPENLSSSSLPIPAITGPGLTTYDARDPDNKYPPIEPVRPPAEAPNVLIIDGERWAKAVFQLPSPWSSLPTRPRILATRALRRYPKITRCTVVNSPARSTGRSWMPAWTIMTISSTRKNACAWPWRGNNPTAVDKSRPILPSRKVEKIGYLYQYL